MLIKVNGHAVEIFAGATVKDALRKYSREEWASVRNNEKTVRDGHGHEIGLAGELSEGAELFTAARAAAGPRS